MNQSTSRSPGWTLIAVALMLAFSLEFVATLPAAAQEGGSPPLDRPFQLPFADPPSPNSWLMAQPYGNTTGAYRRRFTTYGASGGIHFGVDLSAPCGTAIVAIADGVVFAVDGPFGSPPHNLMIDHPQLGYASLYGHLLEAPPLRAGQRVKQGEVIAKVGDSGETCYSRPHLHLEIRDLNHVTKYNPTLLIEANWDNLALTGRSGRDFARDLAAPRKWQSLYDQPEVRTGGPIVNDFVRAWPPDWEQGEGQATAADSKTSLDAATPSPAEAAFEANSAAEPTIGRRLTRDDCCVQPYWSADSNQIRFIDRPGPDVPVGLWGIDLVTPEDGPQLVTGRLALYSPDGRLVAYPDRTTGLAIVERLADGQTWAIDTQERRLNFSPDSQQILWTTYDEDAPRDTRLETIWLANPDGSQARQVLQARRTDAVTWLSPDTLLMARRIPGSSDEQLFTLSLTNGRQTELITLPEMRGLSLSPDKRYLVYSVTFEPEPAKNGLWLLDLENPELGPQKLPFFGTYRWRDNERLIYIPLDLEATEHNFYEFDVATGQSRLLFPEGTGLTIANNDWQVSPDGTRLAMVLSKDTQLDGIWLIDLPQ